MKKRTQNYYLYMYISMHKCDARLQAVPNPYYFCSSYPRNRHKRDRLIKGKNALGQRQLCRDRQKCTTYPRYRDEVRLYVINMDKSKGCKLKLVPNNKRKCDDIYKYLLLDITMIISNPIRIRVNPTVTPAAIPIKNQNDFSQL